MNNCRAIRSENSKSNFLKQLETIVESVKQNRFKIEQRLQEEKSKRDMLNIQLTQLFDKARQYAKVLKDFQEVCFCFTVYMYDGKFCFLRRFEKMNILHHHDLNKFIEQKIVIYFIK